MPQIEYSKEVRETGTGAEQSFWRSTKQAAQYFYYQLRTAEGRAGAISTLQGSGLSEETMRKFGLGYSDKFGGGLYQYP